MFVFKTKSQASAEKVNDYEDFLKSSCELAIFIYDSVKVEIYCKNESVIEKIKSKTNNMYSNVEYITDLNDSRNQFSVF